MYPFVYCSSNMSAWILCCCCCCCYCFCQWACTISHCAFGLPLFIHFAHDDTIYQSARATCGHRQLHIINAPTSELIHSCTFDTFSWFVWRVRWIYQFWLYFFLSKSNRILPRETQFENRDFCSLVVYTVHCAEIIVHLVLRRGNYLIWSIFNILDQS